MKGLERFRDHFRDHTDKFILIGGTACTLIMEELGREFRATKDFDVVLCIDSLDELFGVVFWDFIQAGNYQVYKSPTGKSCFYRFQKPENSDYPFMIELFSRAPDILPIVRTGHIIPIHIDDEVSSLSAILLDPDYYPWIMAGRKIIEGIPIVDAAHIIPLKAKAWLDLHTKRATGKHAASSDIKKHKNDIFRLFQVIDPELKLGIPLRIQDDMATFLTEIAIEEIDLKNLGWQRTPFQTVLAELRKFYGV